jgi:membrane protease YdiL (CAAX protease family)
MPTTRELDAATIAAVLLLALANLVAHTVLPANWSVPWSLLVAAMVAATALGPGGRTLDELGLDPAHLPAGVRDGALVAVAVGAVVASLHLHPNGREVFEDDRGRIGGRHLTWKLLVTIPLGTALYEELVFRGALTALLGARPGWTHQRAVLVAAGLFGLWHVLPSLDLTSQNDRLGTRVDGRAGTVSAVAGSVGATAVAALGFTWLRDRSKSLATPVLAHWAINGAATFAAWRAATRAHRSTRRGDGTVRLISTG